MVNILFGCGMQSQASLFVQALIECLHVYPVFYQRWVGEQARGSETVYTAVTGFGLTFFLNKGWLQMVFKLGGDGQANWPLSGVGGVYWKLIHC